MYDSINEQNLMHINVDSYFFGGGGVLFVWYINYSKQTMITDPCISSKYLSVDVLLKE